MLSFQSWENLESGKSSGRLSCVRTRSRYWSNVRLLSRWIWRWENRDLTRFSNSSRTSWMEINQHTKCCCKVWMIRVWFETEIQRGGSPVCRWCRPQRWAPEPTGRHRTSCIAEFGSYGGRTSQTHPGWTTPGDYCCDHLDRRGKKVENKNWTSLHMSNLNNKLYIYFHFSNLSSVLPAGKQDSLQSFPEIKQKPGFLEHFYSIIKENNCF